MSVCLFVQKIFHLLVFYYVIFTPSLSLTPTPPHLITHSPSLLFSLSFSSLLLISSHPLPPSLPLPLNPLSLSFTQSLTPSFTHSRSPFHSFTFSVSLSTTGKEIRSSTLFLLLWMSDSPHEHHVYHSSCSGASPCLQMWQQRWDPYWLSSSPSGKLPLLQEVAEGSEESEGGERRLGGRSGGQVPPRTRPRGASRCLPRPISSSGLERSGSTRNQIHVGLH